MSAELADAERPDDDRLAEAEQNLRSRFDSDWAAAVVLAEYDRRGAEIERLRVIDEDEDGSRQYECRRCGAEIFDDGDA